MIRIGTAGWDYEDWKGFVYPRPRPRGFDPLALMTRLFDTLEVNVTFYRIPAPSMAASWVARSAGNDRFRFTVKLPGLFTHERAQESAAKEQAFREAIAPLSEAGRLGAILAQFPQSFHADDAGRLYLDRLLDRFADLPLVIEFRHAAWNTEQTLERLRRNGAGFCNIDQPQLGSTLMPTCHRTGPAGYVRLHGRNAANWFREDAGPQARYDYLYARDELTSWIASIQTLAEEGAEVYVITNNHFRGKAAVNALQIRAALEGGLVEAPDTLVAAYPELSEIAKPSFGQLPF